MRNLLNRQLDMLVRLGAFGNKYAHRFEPDGLVAKLFAIVVASIPSLSKSAGSQEAGKALSREGVITKAEAKAELLDCMAEISLAATGIGRDIPGVRSKFRMPPAIGDRALIGVAQGFLENAEKMKDQFVGHGVDLDELRIAIDNFFESIRGREEAKGTQTNATASIDHTIEAAMDAVYRLDAILPIKLRKDYPVLKEWEGARRVARARITVKPVPETTTNTTTTTTT
jgi:hypothetical protein